MFSSPACWPICFSSRNKPHSPTRIRSAFMHSSLRPISLALLSLVALLSTGAISRGPTPAPPATSTHHVNTLVTSNPHLHATPPHAASPAAPSSTSTPPKTAAAPHTATSTVRVTHQTWNPHFDSHALA